MPRTIIWSGNIPGHRSDAYLPREVTRLDNRNVWTLANREFRLRYSPHVFLRETETLAGRLADAVSTKDWRVLLQQMQNILATEGEVGLFIALQFQQLAADDRSATRDNQRTPTVRDALTAFRSALIAEQQQLISQEPALHNIV